MKIQNELQDLISNDDNSKTIKLINEIPTIVKKKHVKNKKKLIEHPLYLYTLHSDIVYGNIQSITAHRAQVLSEGLIENDYMLRCEKPDLFHDDFVLKTEYVVNQVAPLPSGKAVHSTKLTWNDSEVKFQAKLRDVAFGVFRENETDNNWNTYKMARNTTLQLLRRKKRDYYFN
ncbi:hypothetical protein HHI36_023671 [Cryptolaemus montrouzieri]|uniref:Uncharacterized protein n=1 Tax=Cryptolaemus montrouzieri TaxID=559131 RepID=A0ABD2PHR2_9CUCU